MLYINSSNVTIRSINRDKNLSKCITRAWNISTALQSQMNGENPMAILKS